MTVGRAAAIQEYLALNDETYSEYSGSVARFVTEMVQFEPFCLPIRKLRMVQSKLFGRKFLVANPMYEDDGLIGAGLNAVAIESIEVAGFQSPPIVVTAKRQQGQDRLYRSILEHEFVHICQMLLGRLADFEADPGGPTLFLEARTRAEFEAYYLQHFHWPDLYPAQQTRGMSAEDYCLFSAYVHSLEDTLKCILGEGASLPVLSDFLDTTPVRLHDLISPMGFSDATCQYYRAMFPGHIETALGVITENSPLPLPDQFVDFIKTWLKGASPGSRGAR